MEAFAFKALQLILALIILVTIHEFGHYLFARIFGIKVNRFYLFFNPYFSLLKYDPRKGTLQIIGYGENKAWRTVRVGRERQPREDGKPTWRDTLYGLGWLPLGGYCDIAGMVDETKSAKDLEAVAQPWEFRSKSAPKRLMVMIAGVLFNFILAIIIYAGIAFHWGDHVVPYESMTEGMSFSDELKSAGFQDGDILLTVNGERLDPKDYSAEWDMLQPGTTVGVLRNHCDTVNIAIGDNLIKQLATKDKDYRAMTVRVPVVVAKVMNGEGAAQAGLEPKDRIVKVAADTTPSISEFMPTLQANAGKTVDMVIIRNEQELTIPVAINDLGKIGIQMLSPDEIFEFEVVEYNIFQAIPRGWEIGTDRLVSYVSSLKLLFSKEGAQSVGGFGTLGDLFPNQWNWYAFWQITAFLSVILAFMNIIPIPALDGGYTLFLIVEMITRRKPSERFLEIANTIGMGFLFLLLLYANGNDIYRLFIK
jgi:regulator of sigma E protease